MRVLVTGATGFIGGAVARAALARNFEVAGRHRREAQPVDQHLDRRRGGRVPARVGEAHLEGEALRPVLGRRRRPPVRQE